MGGDPVLCGSGVTSVVVISSRRAPEPGLASSGTGRGETDTLLEAGLGRGGVAATAGAEGTCSGGGACSASDFWGSRATRVEDSEDGEEVMLGNSLEPCGPTAPSNS